MTAVLTYSEEERQYLRRPAEGRDRIRSWISPGGAFIPAGNDHHDAAVAAFGVDFKSAMSSMWDLGYRRVAYQGATLLIDDGPLTSHQKRALIRMAIEEGFNKVTLDWGPRDITVWEDK